MPNQKLLKEYIDFSGEFKHAFDVMENSWESVFVTGKAGTGKSTLLRYFKANTKKNAVVLAPTGLAAVNAEGQTIHSFFNFPARFIDRKHIKKSYSKIFRKIDTVVIDEISMVRADLFDGIDTALRVNRKSREPFGGVQLVLFGDLYQLPPVVTAEESPVIEKRYNSPYFFNSKVMDEIDLRTIELKKVYRQKDERFIAALDLIRAGSGCKEGLELINTREGHQNKGAVILTPTNRIADAINSRKLSGIPSRELTYMAELDGDFKKYNAGLPVDIELKLKKGARVIFTKNDPNGMWVNGSLGWIYELDTDIRVQLDSGGVVTAEKATWEKRRYDYDEAKDTLKTEVTGKVKQFPLRLAWALTIHKSQGQTFDSVAIDLSTFPWEHGQTYVALSRCRTLEGISLTRKIFPPDVIVDPVITAFIKNGYSSQKKIRDFEE